LRRGDGDTGVVGGGEIEGAAFEPPEVAGEAVAHPGQDLELVAGAILEDEQVARERVAVQDGTHHAGQ